MIPLLAIGLPVAIALLLWWMSAATDRRNRRSMQRYGSALDVLGDVSRRSEAVAPVSFPAPAEVARPHIGFDPVTSVQDVTSVQETLSERSTIPSSSESKLFVTGESQRLPLFDDLQPQRETPDTYHDANATAAALRRMVARSRFNREYGITSDDMLVTESESRVHLSVPSGEVLSFGGDEVSSFDDVEDADAVAFEEPRVRRFGSVTGRSRDLRVGPPRGSRRRRQIAAGIVAAVIVLGGVLFVTLRHTPAPIAGKSPSTLPTNHAPGGATSPTSSTVPPNILAPTSATATLVTYEAPSSKYTLVFSSTGPCWLGAEHRVNGVYIWMDTLSAGTTTSYRASGTRVIRLGAPRVISITLNGIPIALPTKLVVPYDIKLVVPRS